MSSSSVSLNGIPFYYGNQSYAQRMLHINEIEKAFLDCVEGSETEQLWLLGFSYFFGIMHEANFERAKEIAASFTADIFSRDEEGIEEWYFDQFRSKASKIKDFHKFFTFCEERASVSEYKIYYIVAACYFYGLGVEKNISKAEEIFKLLDERSPPYSKLNYTLGMIYKYGVSNASGNIAVNYPLAIEQFEKAIKNLGHTEASFELGHCYEKGLGVEIDYNKAYSHYAIAEKGKSAKAAYRLGLSFESMSQEQDPLYCKTGRNEERAVRLFTKSAFKGHAAALFKLSNIYKNGLSLKERSHGFMFDVVNKHMQRSLRCLRRAVEMNHNQAIYELGLRCKKGIGLTVNLGKALVNFTKLQHLDVPDVHYQLAKLHLTREAGFFEPNIAVEHLSRAAAKGYAKAKYYLARSYIEGTGGLVVDHSQAVSLLEEAARQNHYKAYLDLSLAYEKGSLGLMPSLDMTKKMLDDALRVKKDSSAYMRLGFHYFFCMEETDDNVNLGIRACQNALVTKVKPYDEELNGRIPAIIKIVSGCNLELIPPCSLLIQFHEHGYLKSDDPIFTRIIEIQVQSCPESDSHRCIVRDLLLGIIYSNILQEKERGLEYCYKASQNLLRNKDFPLMQLLRSQEIQEVHYILAKHYWELEDYTNAIKYCNLANVTKNNWRSQAILGECYLYGKGVESPNIYLARKNLQLPASRGDVLAMTHLGLCCEKTKEIEEGVRLFELASHAGNPEAQFRLSHYYLHGSSIQENPCKQDEKRAAALLEAAALQDHPEALCELSECYRLGRGVVSNMKEAERLLRLADEKGSAQAKHCLQHYLNTMEVDEDLESSERGRDTSMQPMQSSIQERRPRFHHIKIDVNDLEQREEPLISI